MPLTPARRKLIHARALQALELEAHDVAERRYYDEQTGTWCIAPDDAFAAGALWAVTIPDDREGA